MGLERSHPGKPRLGCSPASSWDFDPECSHRSHGRGTFFYIDLAEGEWLYTLIRRMNSFLCIATVGHLGQFGQFGHNVGGDPFFGLHCCVQGIK